MNALTSPTEGQILTGSLFNEPMRVETVARTGPDSWTLGLVGARSERFRKVSLGAAELAGLTVLDSGFRYDGDGALLRLGLQAHALGIAWEFDPYFGLSVSTSIRCRSSWTRRTGCRRARSSCRSSRPRAASVSRRWSASRITSSSP